MTIEQLNADYGIADKVEIVAGKGGFPVIKVNNEHAKATISVYAAQVISFQAVDQTEDIMFLSNKAYYQEGKSMKGGTPICWPWFGPDPEGKGRSSHGFVRNRMWNLREVASAQDGATKIVLGLTDTPETRAIWDFAFDLETAITVGKSLTIELITCNTGDKTFTITQALHTYFKVGDINQVQILGLADNKYIDKVDSGQKKNQSGDISFDRECDRIYLNVDPEITIDDGELGRKIKVSSTNSKTAIVWNPWATISANMADLEDNDYQNFVCVETANAANEVIEVAKGSEYKLAANYAIDS